MSLGELIAWRPHPEVWVLVVTLVGGYWWAVRRLAPYYVSKGQPVVSRLQVAAYLAGVGAVWAVSDWPLHDIAEEALLSIHMVEHLALALIVPPLIILGVPGWLWRVLLDPVLPLVRRITHPMVGLLLFNTVFAATHWPPVIAVQNQSEWWHFTVHVVLVASGFIMFWPVLNPLPEIPRLRPALAMGYLFLMTIIPTIPASFLTFTNTFLYSDAYPPGPRLWGLDAVTDQQIAGLLMKLGGGVILWTMITVIFFRWVAAELSIQAEASPPVTKSVSAAASTVSPKESGSTTGA